MTREELQAIVETAFGLRSRPDLVDTIMRAADAYAIAMVEESFKPIPVEDPE